MKAVGISQHPKLLQEITSNMLRPVVILDFEKEDTAPVFEPVVGSYMALRIVPRKDCTKMVLKCLSFKGKHSEADPSHPHIASHWPG